MTAVVAGASGRRPPAGWATRLVPVLLLLGLFAMHGLDTHGLMSHAPDLSPAPAAGTGAATFGHDRGGDRMTMYVEGPRGPAAGAPAAASSGASLAAPCPGCPPDIGLMSLCVAVLLGGLTVVLLLTHLRPQRRLRPSQGPPRVPRAGPPLRLRPPDPVTDLCVSRT